MTTTSLKQIEIYDFLVDYTTKNGYPPCIREICEAVSLKSTSSVYHYLQALQRAGQIEMKENSQRAIKLIGYKLAKE